MLISEFRELSVCCRVSFFFSDFCLIPLYSVEKNMKQKKWIAAHFEKKMYSFTFLGLFSDIGPALYNLTKRMLENKKLFAYVWDAL